MLLTGSNGFVGRHTTDAAQAAGWRVIGLGRSAQPATTPSGRRVDRYLSHDLRRPLIPHLAGRLAGLLDEPVDAIVHAAALASPWASPRDYIDHNIRATQHVIEWAATHDCPPVHFISSSSVFYRPTDQFDISESTPIPADRDQVNGYSRSKVVAERLVATYPGPWSILRPRAVIGPGDTVVLPRVVEAAHRGQLPLFRRRDGQTVRCDLTPVQTIAHDIVAAATTTATGAYTLTNGETVELYPFLLDVLRRLDVPAPTRRLPVGLAMAAAGLAEQVSARFADYREPAITRFGISMFAYSKTFDATRARTAFGPPPLSLTECVDGIVASWKPATDG